MSKNIHATQDWVRDNLGIKLTASGELISLSDSAEQPLQSMKIFGKTEQFTTTGKNKLPYPYTNTTITSKGITFTDNGDRTITCNGTAEETVFFRLRDLTDGFMVSAGEYTLSGCPSGGSNSTYHLYCVNKSQSAMLLNDAGNGATATLASDEIYGFYIKISNGQTVSNLTFKPMLRPVGTDNTWEPYTGGIPSPNPDYPQELVSVGDSGSTTEYVMGKNLISDDVYDYNNWVAYEGHSGRYYILNLPEGVYTVSANATEAETYLYIYKSINGGPMISECTLIYGTKKSAAHTLSVSKGDTYYLWTNIAYLPNVFDIQLEAGSVATPYEPYKEQSLTIPTPNGLPGVPVSSGGNYTDSNGQQYVCDYKDHERNVYVRRVGSTVINTVANYGVHNNGTPYVSKTIPDIKIGDNKPIKSDRYRGGSWSNKTYNVYTVGNRNVVLVDERFTSLEVANEILSTEQPKIYYELETPIETPLTEEEIQAYKALHTNYPNTTIYNSDGAGAEVGYVADTKNYIDNKIAELQANILSVAK